MQIAADNVVLIHYTLKDDDGKVLGGPALSAFAGV